MLLAKIYSPVKGSSRYQKICGSGEVNSLNLTLVEISNLYLQKNLPVWFFGSFSFSNVEKTYDLRVTARRPKTVVQQNLKIYGKSLISNLKSI